MKLCLAGLVSVAAMAVAPALVAQTPARGSATGTIGGKKVSVDYGTVDLKGRAVADLLKQLPPERIWRTGANEVSTFTTEGDVVIGGTTVKAGKYSLYTHIPESGPWTLVLNGDLGQPLGQLWKEAPAAMKNAPFPYLGNYEAAIKGKEVLRVAMTQGKATTPVETLKIALVPSGTGATLALSWGDQAWSLAIAPVK